MTAGVDEGSIQVFLEYDFEQEEEGGSFLAIERRGGRERLCQLSSKSTGFGDLIARSLFYDRHLAKVVAFVDTHFSVIAIDAKGEERKRWQLQYGWLQRKVERYNQNPLRHICFVNPLLDRLSVIVTLPQLTDESESRISIVSKVFMEIYFSPLTSFEEVEIHFKEKFGPEGFYTVDETFQRGELATLAAEKKRVVEWIGEGKEPTLRIGYAACNFIQKQRYEQEIASIFAYYKGRVEAKREYGMPRRSRYELLFPETGEENKGFRKKIKEVREKYES